MSMSGHDEADAIIKNEAKAKGNKASLEKAINELVEASQEWAFKGSQPPSSHSFIEARFKAAKLRLRIMTGASEATPTKVKHLHQWEGIVKAGYEGPTDEERGG